MRTAFYHVIPRYSCGSPGMVDEKTAMRVAEDEKRAYPGYLTGSYGVGDKEIAEREGLEGIVLVDNGKDKYTDIITGREYGDVPYAAIRHPNKLVVLAKGRKARYYYRRQFVGEFNGTRPDDSMRQVMNAMRDMFGIDAYSVLMNTIWKEQMRSY